MTVIRVPVRSRLSTLINQPGGVSVGAALRQARSNLSALKPQALSAIEGALNELLAIPAPTPETQAAALDRAYTASNAVIDAGGPFELRDLCRAAAGLCDLIDANQGARFDWRIVQSHAQAMRVLLTLPDHDVEARAAIREHLQAVLDRKLTD
jgi:hypothetical protein